MTCNIQYRNLPLETKSPSNSRLSSPSNVTQARNILALASYYRRFIPMFSSIVFPITSLTKKNGTFVWTAACQTVLDMIKHAITNSPVLIYPDINKQYHLFTDASNNKLSGVLTQTRETYGKMGI